MLRIISVRAYFLLIAAENHMVPGMWSWKYTTQNSNLEVKEKLCEVVDHIRDNYDLDIFTRV